MSVGWETQVKHGTHGRAWRRNELVEKRERHDPCPCGQPRRFQAVCLGTGRCDRVNRDFFPEGAEPAECSTGFWAVAPLGTVSGDPTLPGTEDAV
jgi:hypothetical protein